MSRYIDADKIEYQSLPLAVLPHRFATELQISKIPEADVESVRHAYWEKECRSEIIFPSGKSAVLIERKCSNCHHWSDKEILKYYLAPSPRCSVCGAKMDEKGNEQ